MADIVRISLFFPNFVYEDGNKALMEKISKEKLKEVLQSFQRDKALYQMDGLSNSS
jgi:hypothetical protein